MNFKYIPNHDDIVWAWNIVGLAQTGVVLVTFVNCELIYTLYPDKKIMLLRNPELLKTDDVAVIMHSRAEAIFKEIGWAVIEDYKA